MKLYVGTFQLTLIHTYGGTSQFYLSLLNLSEGVLMLDGTC